MFSAGIATSTHRSYRSGCSRYVNFCDSANLTPFPTSEKNLILFVAQLFKDGLAGSTIKSYLAAVRYSQIALGLGNPHIPSMTQLEYVLKGAQKSARSKSRPRLPITPSILEKLYSVWAASSDPFNASMLWAAACMCFFGFLRSGEVVAPSKSSFDAAVTLCYGDVSVDSTSNPQVLQVHLKASKTDPYRLGVSVYLGRTGHLLCPVSAVLGYMVKRGSQVGPFFLYEDGSFLTRSSFVDRLRLALSRAGLSPEKYSGHSFRIGAATTAAQVGLPDTLIKTLGRWQSSAYSLYIRTPRDTLCNVSKQLIISRS